jgi:thioredoxin reductase (NADPH)
MSNIYESIIVGSGPAGYTASIYLGRANIKHLVIGGAITPGGNLMFTSDIENFPGFDEGISGPKLMTNMQTQAEKYGAEVVFDDVTKIEKTGDLFKVSVTMSDVPYEAKSIIIATGGKYKQLGVPGEKEYAGKGVSYCATCDGFFFKDKWVSVIGGGDSAFEEAIYLSSIANLVSIVHRRNEFRASKIMVDRAKAIKNIQFITPVEVEEIYGDSSPYNKNPGVKGLKFTDGSQLNSEGIFISIGHSPNSSVFENLVEVDDNGYIVKAKEPGVFIAGDVADPVYKQAIIAAASGAKAAIDTTTFLE